MPGAAWTDADSDSDSEDELLMRLKGGSFIARPNSASFFSPPEQGDDDIEEEDEAGACQFCGDKPAEEAVKCAICLVTSYCSRSCQRLDFQRHRTLCMALSQKNQDECASESEDDEYHTDTPGLSDEEQEEEEEVAPAGRPQRKKSGRKLKGTITTEPIDTEVPKAMKGSGARAVPLATPMDDKGVSVLTEKEKERLQHLGKKMEEIETVQLSKMQQIESEIARLKEGHLSSQAAEESSRLQSQQSFSDMQSVTELQQQLENLRSEVERAVRQSSMRGLGLGLGSELIREPTWERSHSTSSLHRQSTRQSLTESPSTSRSLPAMSSHLLRSLLPPAVPEAAPMLVKDDPAFSKYFKLLSMGMPKEQVQQKMRVEGVDCSYLDTPDEVSPNDTSAAASLPSPPSPSVTEQDSAQVLQHLYALVMQHQAVISRQSTVSLTALAGAGSQGSLHTSHQALSSSSPTFPASLRDGSSPESPQLEDTMALELAQTEAEVESLFADVDNTTQKDVGGLTLVQQLERRARKEQNQKIVQHREAIKELSYRVCEAEFGSVDEVLALVREALPRLESYGLLMGHAYEETWASRLTMKSKETGEMYFSLSDREAAGRCYQKLWTMSVLEHYMTQLDSRMAQILAAPTVYKDTALTKPQVVDKYIALLKEAYKANHKIFKSAEYKVDIERMRRFNIPQELEKKGRELVNSAVVLADASMAMAEEELRVFGKMARGKSLRAPSTVFVGEKVVQLLVVLQKMGVEGLDLARLEKIQSEMEVIKSQYGQQAEEEEEEDVF